MCLLILTSCTGVPVVPVSDLSSEKSNESYVKVGDRDTLYSIAWTLGLDYRDLARWNNISPPYNVTVGQKIFLNQQTLTLESSTQSRILSTEKIQSATILEEDDLRNKTLASSDELNLNIKFSTSSDFNSRIVDKQKWVWPAEGRLAKLFSPAEENNGIDIEGQVGSDVRAISDGQVVYAGDGLRGYGFLLIIKHNDRYLSAYAHNNLLLVKEGDIVEAAQVIAQMGDTESDTVALHLEIRKNGEPVNPLNFLPLLEGL